MRSTDTRVRRRLPLPPSAAGRSGSGSGLPRRPRRCPALSALPFPAGPAPPAGSCGGGSSSSSSLLLGSKGAPSPASRSPSRLADAPLRSIRRRPRSCTGRLQPISRLSSCRETASGSTQLFTSASTARSTPGWLSADGSAAASAATATAAAAVHFSMPTSSARRVWWSSSSPPLPLPLPPPPLPPLPLPPPPPPPLLPLLPLLPP